MELRLQVELGTDPITGWLSMPQGPTWSFVGWIALVTALENAMRLGASPPPEHTTPRGHHAE